MPHLSVHYAHLDGDERNSGAIAQLGERYTGSVEVGGSIPPSSTKISESDFGVQ